MFFQTPQFDLTLQRLINVQWRNEFLDVLMPIVSDMKTLVIILIPIIAVLVYRRGPRQLVLFLVLVAGLGMADFTTNFVKDGVGRVRPLNAIAGTHFVEDGKWQQRGPEFVQTKEHGSSYPSAHAANTMCLAILAGLLWPATRRWIFVVPLVVGYSRVYLGKHYPLDVLMGWLFGIAVALTVWLIWSRLVNPALERRSRG